MKKIILITTFILMSFTTLQAMNDLALAHVNPMPNLMRIAMGNAELLHLTQEQKEALKSWSKTNKPKMLEMMQKVINEEHMLLENALTTDNDSAKEAEVMLETRKQIIALKTKCRANLKNVLTKEQYAQLISIYRSVN